MTETTRHFDLTRIILGILFIAIMVIACFWIVQPFIFGFAWAGMVVIATWPLLIHLQYRMGGKRLPAVLVMTLLLILLFVTPVGLLINSIIDSSPKLIELASDSKQMELPALDLLHRIPFIGEFLNRSWDQMMTDGGKSLIAKIQPYAGQTATWFLSQVVNIGHFMLHATLMVIFSALLYYNGEAVAHSIHRFAVRLSPSKGVSIVVLAAQAIRAVALGVVVTALVQSILGGIGIASAGIGYATLLTILMFITCLAQLGPLPILVPAIIWLYWSGDNTWGTILLVWSVLVAMLDNVLRPALIKMGADLPLLLILSGVIGGMLAFGMIGLFLGPVVLAVTYRLVSAWVTEDSPALEIGIPVEDKSNTPAPADKSKAKKNKKK